MIAPAPHTPRAEQQIRCWYWPNILAIDAALVAVAWQWVFSRAFLSELAPSAYWVLGLSVWLTYMADRLFDIRQRQPKQLLSLRHTFAKKHSNSIWLLWWIVLLLDITLALTALNESQIYCGTILLAVCLLYTLLNQKRSASFFPKEICVALIYAGGVIIFQERLAVPWTAIGSFTVLCLINCLMISFKERHVDIALEVQSIGRLTNRKMLWVIWLLALLACFKTPHNLQMSIAITLAMLAVIHILTERICVEDFRVLTDAALLSGVLASYLKYSL